MRLLCTRALLTSLNAFYDTSAATENINIKISSIFSPQANASILDEKLNRRPTTNSPLKTTNLQDYIVGVFPPYNYLHYHH